MIRYATVCSGVGTCALAWHRLGWETAWFAEIGDAPSAILAHRFPETCNHDDMAALCERVERADESDIGLIDLIDIDVLGGGTPCQSFSIAGLRSSLEDTRGNLSLVFCRLVHAIDDLRRARGHGRGLSVAVWENVPGVLSTPDNAFGCILGALVGADLPVLPDGGWKRSGLVVGPRRTAAYRVLDAQYFGLAQRRERVVVVSCSRTSGIDPCEVLFEREGVRRDSAPSRKAQKDLAGAIASRAGGGGFTGQAAANGRCIAHALTGEGLDASEDGTGQGAPIVAHTLTAKGGSGGSGRSDGESETFIACQFGEISHALTTQCGRATESCAGNGNGAPLIPIAFPYWAVRRITPREAERLQGYPDDHTLVPYHGKPMKDGPRYKAIGNGWARPVFEWVGRRIATRLSLQ